MTELMPSLCNDCVARNQCGNDDVKMCVSYIKEVKIKCDDCKFVENCVDYGWQGCKKFTPKQSEPITNEEYLHSLNTEQLAKVLLSFCQYPCEICKVQCDDGNACTYNKALNTIVEWLKQPHTPKE